MKFKTVQIFEVITFILAFNYIVFELLKFDDLSQTFKALVFLPFFLIYFFSKRSKEIFFSLFLLLYALAEFVYLAMPFLGRGLYYKVSAFLYITSFICLLIYLLKGYQLKRALILFPMHIIVLLFFGAILVYKFDVFYVTNVSVNCKFVERVTENLYNSLLALIVINTFIRFLYFKTTSSILLFLACSFLVFSEFIQIISYSTLYPVLSTSTSLLTIFSFYFFYEYFNVKEPNETNN